MGMQVPHPLAKRSRFIGIVRHTCSITQRSRNGSSLRRLTSVISQMDIGLNNLAIIEQLLKKPRRSGPEISDDVRKN